MLTGDKAQAALEVAEKITLCNAPIFHLQTLEDLEDHALEDLRDLRKKHLLSTSCLINGRLLSDLVDSKYKVKFKHLCQHFKNRIVYRATPDAKQLYIRFLQQEVQEVVLFVGDDMNDVVGSLEATTSCAVSNACGQRTATADMMIPNWHHIPLLLKEFQYKQSIVHNMTIWILMKHFQTAAHLLLLFLMSEFQVLKDPASPFLMNIFNATLFAMMCVYCWTERSPWGQFRSFPTLIIKGFMLVLNASIVFYFLDANNGIFLLLGIQILQLACQLERFSERNVRRMTFHVILAMLWIVVDWCFSLISFLGFYVE